MQAVVYALGIYFENAVEVFLTRCLGRSYVSDAGVVDKYGDLPTLSLRDIELMISSFYRDIPRLQGKKSSRPCRTAFVVFSPLA